MFPYTTFDYNSAFADEAHRAVKIIKPVHKAVVSNPVEICMEAYGLEVESTKNGVNEGKGHHHVMIDMYAPVFSEMDKPLKKDSRFIHLSDGSACVKLHLPTGRHFIRTLFARGNHVPYSPLISDTIIVYIK
jgi:hypothetical protein